MGKVLIEESILMWLEKTLNEMEVKIKRPPAELFSRQVQGVQSGLAVALPGNVDSYTAINGLDMTVECDSKVLLVDAIVTCSFSGSPATTRFAVEVDGVVDTSNFATFSPTAITAIQYYGSFACAVMPGRHQIRLMMSITTARTVTFPGFYRYMRVTGLTNPRKG